MVLRKTTFNGEDSVIYNSQNSQVMSMQNADDAYNTGVTGTILLIFSDMFSLKTTATYTYGRYHDTENDTIVPMDHIPPAFGQTSLSMKTKKAESEFYVRYNAWKELRDYSPSGEDNLQYATPFGMPAWITLNAKTSFKLNKSIALNAGLENILDNHYRVFASGISAPGRNFYIALRGKF